MGITYRALDVNLRRPVALKVISEHEVDVTARIIDLGLAKTVEPAVSGAGISTSGRFAGTPHFVLRQTRRFPHLLTGKYRPSKRTQHTLSRSWPRIYPD